MLTLKYVVSGPDVVLFAELVSPGDSPHLVSADAVSNSSFTPFVILLTNGQDDTISFTQTRYVDGAPPTTTGYSGPESAWFHLHPSFPTVNGIDLFLYEITSIDLHIDSVTVIPPAPEIFLPYPGLAVQGRYVFNGFLIPEPSAASLVLYGLVLFTAITRHRSRRSGRRLGGLR
jgi:hypothetical protein